MLQSTRKKQRLSRYLKDFKHKQTHCSHCNRELDRVSLAYRHQLVNKKSMSFIDSLIDDETWQRLQQDLIPLCRFCSEIICNTHTIYFDIKAFTQYLIDQTEVRHSTMREYVIRLRRLDELLAAKNYPKEDFVSDNIQQHIYDYLPDIESDTYRSALRKYGQYLDWHKYYR
ncbi:MULTISPECIES: flagella biosynthesis regulatory protein FliZ [unclassified Brenneria]|uniref:flagella biosynthesis regulatory protein FliZ n=1 Tax=unclassified Brenneria TaxID=2634434 RepID=UPI0029C43F6A|nr:MULTISPECIES: flagella biosynthesis regulatory protein FliZ [unclassified Brenneria]MDX5626444.1 flagella biosynthesis regulatory protein FliZ [Brenneria sp. L3-3Z]MDX5694206.1 flagella biosynthesis regulatory protein FliZ [Brenneria sp. L4-2C]MEE3662564.1 flagella biosynthesis regulatory protein FliZ [Brenneria sp. g21c3]